MPGIGKTVRRLREQKEFSQGKLAKRAGLSLNTVVKLEIGENTNPTIGTLLGLAKALGVPVERLLE